MTAGSEGTVRDAIAAWAGGDLDRLRKLTHAEVEIDATRRALNPTTFAGWEGMAELLAETAEAWSWVQLEPEDVDVRGDAVVVAGRLRGRGSGSGIEVDQSVVNAFVVRDGRIARWILSLEDEAAALAALGIEPDVPAG